MPLDRAFGIFFTNAMDAQQRLLVVRAQVDRLQEQLAGLQKYKKLLDTILDHFVGSNQLPSQAGAAAKFAGHP